MKYKVLNIDNLPKTTITSIALGDTPVRIYNTKNSDLMTRSIELALFYYVDPLKEEITQTQMDSMIKEIKTIINNYMGTRNIFWSGNNTLANMKVKVELDTETLKKELEKSNSNNKQNKY